MRDVKRRAGAAVNSDLAHSIGTPIVVNTTTGALYVLNDSNAVVEIGSSVGSAINTSGQMSEDAKTEIIETSGLTRTLPQANASRIGMDWTILLNVSGNVLISPDTGDSIVLPGTSTSVYIVNKGDSLTFRCLDASTWGIV